MIETSSRRSAITRPGVLLPPSKPIGVSWTRSPRDHRALNLLGVLNAQRGALGAGCELIGQALKLAPDNAEYHANFGQVRLLAGDRDGAEQSYRRSLALDPGHIAAGLNLANLLLAKDQVDEAALLFREVIRHQPECVSAFEGLGFACQRQHLRGEARVAFEQALALSPAERPERAPILANLAGLLLEDGDAGAAVERLRQAVALAPAHADFQANLGIALYAYGRLPEALAALEQALTLEPGHCRALGTKGVLLYELGRSDEAKLLFDYEDLLEVSDLEPGSGFESLADFNQALARQVLAAPSLVAGRAGKTTRGGSQTGELFHHPEGALGQLVHRIDRAISRYFAQPQTNPHRPNRPSDARLTGWATVLESGGHQDPHNHPSGRLSGVYYVQLPDGADGAGDLEFGRPSERLGARVSGPLHRVTPKPGRIVLFPSYFWHRTLPFHSETARISIAFDLIPASR